MFFKKELKEYIIAIHECDKSKLFEWWFFFDLIKAECVHMHTDSFNLKKFSVMSQQSISLCQLEAHVII